MRRTPGGRAPLRGQNCHGLDSIRYAIIGAMGGQPFNLTRVTQTAQAHNQVAQGLSSRAQRPGTINPHKITDGVVGNSNLGAPQGYHRRFW